MSTMSNGTIEHHDPPALRVVGHVAAVVGGGFVLLNIAFGAYAAWFQLVHSGLGALVGRDGPGAEGWGLVGNVVVLVGWLLAVGWITAWMLRRWPTGLGTSMWLCVPTVSVLLPIGIALVDYPVALTLSLGAALVVGVLWLMARAHRPWEQLLSVGWVAVALAAMVLLGVDI